MEYISEILKDALVEWWTVIRFLGFWALWVGYVLIYCGQDRGLAEEHPSLWLGLVAITLFVYVIFQDYLEIHTYAPVGLAMFATGFFIGRFIPVKAKPPPTG